LDVCGLGITDRDIYGHIFPYPIRYSRFAMAGHMHGSCTLLHFPIRNIVPPIKAKFSAKKKQIKSTATNKAEGGVMPPKRGNTLTHYTLEKRFVKGNVKPHEP
jgi:hypothetical protein